MSNQRHCMIDIETLSTKPTACILSIAAARFDESKIHDEFKVNIDPKTCRDLGLSIDKETVAWWKEHPEAMTLLKQNQKPIDEALNAFTDWFGTDKNKYLVWSHGITFDLVILENAFSLLNIPVPWKFYKTACVRTLVNLSGIKVDRMDGVHHDPMGDVRSQVKYLQKYFLKSMEE